MANFRMFSKAVTENDKFYTLSGSAQGLYLHLVMNADDDGVVDSPIGIRRAAGMTEADFQELIDRGYILYRCEVAVIVHWHAQNSIKGDRYKATEYPEAVAGLAVNDKGKYVPADEKKEADFSSETEPYQSGEEVETECFRSGDEAETERKQSGDSSETIERDIDINNLSLSPPIVPPTPSGAEGKKAETELLTAKERERLTGMMGSDRLELYLVKMQSFVASEGKSYKNPAATIEKWYREDMEPTRRRERQRDKKPAGSFETDEFFNAALRKSYGGPTEEASAE